MVWEWYFVDKNDLYPIRFTEYLDWLLYTDDIFRSIIIDILQLYTEKYCIIKDLIRAIESEHLVGQEIGMDQILKAHNKNELFHDVLDTKLPLNFNRISLYDGLLINEISNWIEENDLPYMAQFVKSEYMTAIINRIKDEYVSDVPRIKKIYRRVLENMIYECYKSRGVTSGYDRVLEDYLRLCDCTKRKRSLTYNSLGRIQREHDLLSRELNAMSAQENIDTLPSSIVAEKSVFLHLRDILPDEFEWINTDIRLMEEGRAQHNCVYTYKYRISKDVCAIYHWEHEGRKYTIEFGCQSGCYIILQIMQKYNQTALPKDRDIVNNYIMNSTSQE